MRILFLPRSHDATAHYRCVIPMKNLKKAGHEVRMNYVIEKKGRPGLKRSDVDWAEVIIFQRPVTSDEVAVISSVKQEDPNKVVLGDYDDDYDNVPNWNPGYTFVNAHRAEWRDALGVYDGVIVSTVPLRNLCEQFTTKPIYLIKNGMDVEEIDSVGLLNRHHAEKVSVTENGKIMRDGILSLDTLREITKGKEVIGWFGSRSHYVDIDWLPEQITELMERDRNIFCIFVGYATWRFALNLPSDRFFMIPGITPVADYWSLLKTVRIDIALAPVDPIVFNKSKSAIKILEAMLMNIFPIASEFDTYEEDIHEGCLAGYRYGDWIKAITDVVDMKRNRPEEFSRRVAENNRWVREEHDARLRVPEYEAVLSDVLEKKNQA